MNGKKDPYIKFSLIDLPKTTIEIQIVHNQISIAEEHFQEYKIILITFKGWGLTPFRYLLLLIIGKEDIMDNGQKIGDSLINSLELKKIYKI